MSLMMPEKSKTIHLGLINPRRFFRNCYFRCGPNHMYCDLVGTFLQYAFRPCYLGCGSNIFCLQNSFGGKISPHLHPCIIVGVLSYVLILCFVISLLEGSLESHQSSLTIFSRIRCHIAGGPCFYFIA